MSSGPIDHIGTLYNTTDSGFSETDLIRELIDNALDADPSEVKIDMVYNQESNTYLIIVVDDAGGMNYETLNNHIIINNRKHASDEKNGRFGYGGIAAYFGLTQEGNGKATILSKVEYEPINQLTLDFPKFKRDNKIAYIAHDATAFMSEMWDNYSVNKNHGTLIILECNQPFLSNMIAKLPFENLGRTYYAYINENIKLTLMVNSKLHTQIASNNVIDERNATHIKKTEITVWKMEQKVIVVFKNGNGTPVQFDLEDKKTKQTINLAANGYREIGKINFTSAIRYNPFDKADNWRVSDGGYYLQRGKKVITKIENPYPSTGDFAYRELRASSRHLVKFTTNLDSLCGIQVNKSKIEKHLINKAIFTTIEHLAMDFCKKSWDKIKQPTQRPVTPAPKPVVALTPTPAPAPKPVVALTPAPAPAPKPVVALTPTPAPKPVVALTSTPAPAPKPVVASSSASSSAPTPRKGDALENLQVELAMLATTPKPPTLPTFTFSQPNPISLPQPLPQQLPSIEELIEASENYTKYLKNLKNVETLKNSKTLQIYTLQRELKID